MRTVYSQRTRPLATNQLVSLNDEDAVKKIPFQARTATGDVFDISFPLHAETADSVRVTQIVSLVLETIDKDIAVMGQTANGDVLQAVAMALAVRARMIHGANEQVNTLTKALVADALAAASDAERQSPPVGHA